MLTLYKVPHNEISGREEREADGPAWSRGRARVENTGPEVEATRTSHPSPQAQSHTGFPG